MRFSTSENARCCCKTTARRAQNHCKTCARSLGVRQASFGSVGEVLKRARCGLDARSAPGNAFSDCRNRAILLQNNRAARAKPLQNVCRIARRAPRKFWQRRRSFEARSLRFCRAFGARKCAFRRPKPRDFAAKITARRAQNHCKTCARSLGVRRATFGSGGDVLKRVRCGFGFNAFGARKCV